jgi:hypothetical protein
MPSWGELEFLFLAAGIMFTVAVLLLLYAGRGTP